MPDDDLIAIHEAGHALMAVALNLALARVQVGNDPRYDLADGPDCTSPARRLHRVRTLMAGCAAERVIFDRQPLGGGSDDVQIANLLGPDDDETALRDEVRRFLRLNAGTLRYVAARLVRRTDRRRGRGFSARDENLSARGKALRGGAAGLRSTRTKASVRVGRMFILRIDLHQI
jgi:hypothetical protein